MAKTPVPARLHAILAREAPVGVVFRRGPAKQVATCHWDLETDRITLGQWLKGRIYERRCDLSPDGRHMIAFAGTHNPFDTETGGTWTAVSRTPWLTALDLWPKGDSWNGGGLFLDNARYWLNGCHGAGRCASGLAAVHESPIGPQRNNECLGIYFARLARDGWTELSWDPWRAEFSKPLPLGWVLHKTAIAEVPPPQGAGIYRDEHLLERRDGEVLARPGWEWADRDGRDVVYAEGGCLWRQRVESAERLGEPQLVHDFNAMAFEGRTAPD